MEYWGAEVKSGEQLKVVPGEGRIVHISQAYFGEPIMKKKSAYLFVEYQGYQGLKLLLGTLSPHKESQLLYDLALEGEFKLSHNWKYGSILFSGYKLDYSRKQKIIEPDKEDKAEYDDGTMCEDKKAVLLMNGEDENGEEPLKKADASLIAWFIDDDTIQILAERVADDAELSLIANGILNFLRYNPGSYTKKISASVGRFWKNEKFIKELHYVVVEENQFFIFNLLDHARKFTEEPVEDRVSRIKKDCFFKSVLGEQGSVGKMRGLLSILLGYWLSKDVLGEIYKTMEDFDFPGSIKYWLSHWRNCVPCISASSAAEKQKGKNVEPNKKDTLAIDASLIAWFIDDDTIQILAERVADDAELNLVGNRLLNFLRYNPGSYTKEVSESVGRFWKNEEFIKELHYVVVEENQFLIFDLLDRACEFIEEPVEDRVSRIKKDCLFKRVLAEQGSVGKMRGLLSILLGYWLSKDVLSDLYKAMEDFDFPGSVKSILSCWKKCVPCISAGSAAEKQNAKMVESNKGGAAAAAADDDDDDDDDGDGDDDDDDDDDDGDGDDDDDGLMCEDKKDALPMNSEDENGEETGKKATEVSHIAWFSYDKAIQLLAERVADDAEFCLIANGILDFLRYPESDTKVISENVGRFWKNKAFIKELHNMVVKENQFMIFDILARARKFVEEPVEDRVSRIKEDCLFQDVLEEQETIGKLRDVVSILLCYWVNKDVLNELYKAMEAFYFPGPPRASLLHWKK